MYDMRAIEQSKIKYLSLFSRLEGHNFAEKSRDKCKKDTSVIQT